MWAWQKRGFGLLVVLLGACDPAGPGLDGDADRIDADGDGFAAGPDGEDCDDGAAAVHPGRPEVCDGADNDCDGLVDDEDPDVVPASQVVWHRDGDADGFGAPAEPLARCEVPDGYVGNDDDCDDADSDRHPNTPWYRDGDGDTFGDPATLTAQCEPPSAAHVRDATDCDDANPSAYPGADEVCDGEDNDCDGLVDDDDDDRLAHTGTTWFEDADGDLFGQALRTLQSCEVPAGYVANADDCDDNASAIHPGATEVCDALDNNCDRRIDDDDPALDASSGSVWYADADGDAYGDRASSVMTCVRPRGHVTNSEDCDDADRAIHPAATEVCDGGIDNDCDSVSDDADSSLDLSTATTWFEDADSDMYGNADSTTRACALPSGYVSDDTDCDDAESKANPGETEVCQDGIDNDCEAMSTECLIGDLDLTTDYDARELGVVENERFGNSIAGLGDWDSDGYDNLVIGGPGPATYEGSAWIADGTGSGFNATSSWTEVYGEEVDDFHAQRVAACDVDGDGTKDLLTVSLEAAGTKGRAYLNYGPFTSDRDMSSDADATFDGLTAKDYMNQVACIGDHNGDGKEDFVVCDGNKYVGSIGAAGQCYLFEGASSYTSGSVTSAATATISGASTKDELGRSVAFGDIDNDGYEDLIAGSGIHDGTRGGLWIQFGSKSGTTGSFDSDDLPIYLKGCKSSGGFGDRGDSFGAAVTTGDMDNDGYADVIVGAPNVDHSTSAKDAGAVYAFLGKNLKSYKTGTSQTVLDCSDADVTIASDQARHFFGGGVRAIDLNDDGYDDLVISASLTGVSYSDMGYYLFYSPSTGYSSSYTIDSTTTTTKLYQAYWEAPTDSENPINVWNVGDFNGDGIPDVGLSDPRYDKDKGAVWIVEGNAE